MIPTLHKIYTEMEQKLDLRERERERERNNCFSADSNCFSSANSIPVPQPMFDCSVLCGPSRLQPRSSKGKARVEEKGVLLQPYSHLWHTMKPPHILSKIPPALLPPSSQGKISVYFRCRELPPTVMNISHSIFNLPSRKKTRFPARENATTTLSIKISWIQIGHNLWERERNGKEKREWKRWKSIVPGKQNKTQSADMKWDKNSSSSSI